MKSVGDIIGQAHMAAGSPATPAIERTHRVSLSYMIFAEVCVQAVDARQARIKALAAAKWARRKFAGGPVDYRVEVAEGTDLVTGEPRWVEIDKPGQ